MSLRGWTTLVSFNETPVRREDEHLELGLGSVVLNGYVAQWERTIALLAEGPLTHLPIETPEWRLAGMPISIADVSAVIINWRIAEAYQECRRSERQPPTLMER